MASRPVRLVGRHGCPILGSDASGRINNSHSFALWIKTQGKVSGKSVIDLTPKQVPSAVRRLYQFALQPEARQFYTFEYNGSLLALATITTGQRHCVDLAQRVSDELSRHFGALSTQSRQLLVKALSHSDMAIGVDWKENI